MFIEWLNQTTKPGKWKIAFCCFELGKLLPEYVCTYLFSMFNNLKFFTSLLLHFSIEKPLIEISWYFSFISLIPKQHFS